MSLKESQINTIEMLARHEEAIGTLYETYADKFADYQGFFSHMAREELEHAQWIRRLHAEIEKNALSFKEGRFDIAKLHRSLDYIQAQAEDLYRGNVSLRDALSVALKIEKSIIEEKFFMFVDGDTEAFRRILLYISNGTKDHRTRLEQVYNHNK